MKLVSWVDSYFPPDNISKAIEDNIFGDPCPGSKAIGAPLSVTIIVGDLGSGKTHRACVTAARLASAGVKVVLYADRHTVDPVKPGMASWERRHPDPRKVYPSTIGGLVGAPHPDVVIVDSDTWNDTLFTIRPSHVVWFRSSDYRKDDGMFAPVEPVYLRIARVFYTQEHTRAQNPHSDIIEEMHGPFIRASMPISRYSPQQAPSPWYDPASAVNTWRRVAKWPHLTHEVENYPATMLDTLTLLKGGQDKLVVAGPVGTRKKDFAFTLAHIAALGERMVTLVNLDVPEALSPAIVQQYTQVAVREDHGTKLPSLHQGDPKNLAPLREAIGRRVASRGREFFDDQLLVVLAGEATRSELMAVLDIVPHRDVVIVKWECDARLDEATWFGIQQLSLRWSEPWKRAMMSHESWDPEHDARWSDAINNG